MTDVRRYGTEHVGSTLVSVSRDQSLQNKSGLASVDYPRRKRQKTTVCPTVTTSPVMDELVSLEPLNKADEAELHPTIVSPNDQSRRSITNDEPNEYMGLVLTVLPPPAEEFNQCNGFHNVPTCDDLLDAWLGDFRVTESQPVCNSGSFSYMVSDTILTSAAMYEPPNEAELSPRHHSAAGTPEAPALISPPNPPTTDSCRTSGFTTSVCPSENRRFSDYLPGSVAAVCSESIGSREMLYPWQAECLMADNGGVANGSRNCIISAPTSSGKTLVADVIMLRRLSEDPDRKCLLVLPFVALCQEKAIHYNNLLAPLNKEVKEAFGSCHRGDISSKTTGIIIATPENACRLIFRIMEGPCVLEEEISCVVIDELHMISGDRRGHMLESLLTKIKYCSTSVQMSNASQRKKGIQIIGMSATLSNPEIAAEWLHAELFSTTFRPVPLQQYIKHPDGQLVDEKLQLVAHLKHDSPELVKVDPHGIALLARDTVAAGHGVLIFFGQKRTIMREAINLASCLNIPEKLSSSPNYVSREQAAGAIERANAHQDSKDLANLVRRGVGVHTADLSPAEKEVIQEAFKCGAVLIVLATKTLTTGMNLPARRVILRHLYVGTPQNLLKAAEYRQIAGRAGRAGLDDMGEVVVMRAPYVSEEYVQRLIHGKDAGLVLESQFLHEPLGIERLLLDGIVAGAVRTVTDIESYLRMTLLAHTIDWGVLVSKGRKALEFLNTPRTQLAETRYNINCSAQLAYYDTESEKWEATDVGKAMVATGLPLLDNFRIHADIKCAARGYNSESDLHGTYICIPPECSIPFGRDQISYLLRVVENFSRSEKEIADSLGISLHYLQGRNIGGPPIPCQESRHRRFACALVLCDIIGEVPIESVRQRWKIGSHIGDLVSDTSRFAKNVGAFCQRIGNTILADAMHTLSTRMKTGVKSDIAALAEIEGLTKNMARALFNESICTIEDVATKTNAQMLMDLYLKLHPRSTEKKAKETAKKIVYHARILHKPHAMHLKHLPKELKVQIAEALEAQEGKLHSQTLEPSSNGMIEDQKMVAKQPSFATPAFQTFNAHQLGAQRIGPDVSQLICAFVTLGVDLIGVHFEHSMQTAGRLVPETPRKKKGRKRTAASRHPLGVQPTNADGLVAIAVSWGDSKVAYISVPQQLPQLLVEGIVELLTHSQWRVAFYGLKRSVGALRSLFTAAKLNNPDNIFEHMKDDRLYDSRICTWALYPDSHLVIDGPAADRHLILSGGCGRRKGREPSPRAVLEECFGEQAGADACGGLPDNREDWLDPSGLCACNIAAIAWKIFRLAEPQLVEKNLLAAVFKIEMPLVPVLYDMEKVGIAVNVDGLKEGLASLRRRRSELQMKIDGMAGTQKTAVTHNVSDILFDILHLPPPPTAKKGRNKRYATGKRELEALKDPQGDYLHPIIPVILEYRKINSTIDDISSYLSLAADYGVVSKNSILRLKGNFLQTATGTGRLAMDNPNLQNVPRTFSFVVTPTQNVGSPALVDWTQGGKHRRAQSNVRDGFVAASEDSILVGADYRQLELRLAAHFSNDSAISHLLEGPEDPFTLMAANWRHIDATKVAANDRALAKELCYALFYGLGPGALADRLNIAVQDAVHLREGFLNAFPGIKAKLSQIVAQCRVEKCVTMFGGRKRWFPHIDVDDNGASERAAVNTVMQGSAADIVKRAMVLVHDRSNRELTFGACKLLLQIHDELLFEVKKDELDKALEIIQDCMTGVAALTVSLPVKISVGPSWGQLTEFRKV